MISITGKEWTQQKVNKNLVEKIKQDQCLGDILSHLIISRNYDTSEICGINNPQKLTDVIKKINFLTKKKPTLFKRKLQKADVVKTHGTNKKIKSFIGNQKFTSLDHGLKITVEWFKHYYKI